MNILARIRDLAVIVMCAGAIVVLLEARQALSTANSELPAISADIRKATASWAAYNENLLVFLNDPKTATGLKLLVRSADDAARTIKRINGILDNLNDAIKRTDKNLNDNVFPAATSAIQKTETISIETASAITASRTAIELASADLHNTATGLADSLAGIQRTADSATETIEQVRIVVTDPAIIGGLRQIELTTAESAKTMRNVETLTRRMAKPVTLAWRVIKEGVIILGRIFAP